MSQHSSVRKLDPETLEVIETIPIPRSRAEIETFEISEDSKEFLRRRNRVLKTTKHRDRFEDLDWDMVRADDRKRQIAQSHDDTMTKMELIAALRAIEREPQPNREILKAVLVSGMKAREVAEILGKSTNSIELVVFRFRQQRLRTNP